jgi:hypothetical protein
MTAVDTVAATRATAALAERYARELGDPAALRRHRQRDRALAVIAGHVVAIACAGGIDTCAAELTGHAARLLCGIPTAAPREVITP